MDNNNDIKDPKQREEILNEKIEKMRISLCDSQKCKEIAQKLCAYIAGDK